MQTPEDKIIQSAEQLLGVPPEDTQGWHAEYKTLLSGFKRLKRTMSKVTRMSDKLQEQLNTANEELDEKNKALESREYHLEMLVNEKTLQLKETTIALVNSLENAGLYNDEDTGNHNKRLSEYSAILADRLGCDKDFIKRVRLWAPLHDVGKVGIPEGILKKPAKLSFEEFEKMKQHVGIGFKMLDHPAVDEIAKNIILYHHEKWNGKGYLHNLSKEQIPLEARIVSLADVYDALTQKRVYKEAFSEDKARAIINEENGISFDPAIVDAYTRCQDEIQEVRYQIS